MQYRTLGRTGLKVSVLGMGAVQIGRPEVEDKVAETVLNGALDRGINFIDTAAMYKLSEERIGRYLEKRRDEVILATKCGDYNIIENGNFRTVKDYSRKGVLQTIEESRRKLRTDLIDIVQFHGLPNEKDRRREAIEALLEAKTKGWVRFVGVSIDEAPGADDDLWEMDVQEFAYSVLHQEADETIFPAAEERNIGTVIRGPIANAVYLMKNRPDGTYFAGSWDRAQKLDVCALAGDIPPVEFTLRFTLSHPGVHTAIVGTFDLRETDANVRAVEAGPLPDDVLAEAKRQFKAVLQLPLK